MSPRIRAAVFLVSLSAFGTGCTSAPGVAAPGRVAHTVFFWLRPDAPPGTVGALVAFYRTEVPRAPGVESVVVGVARPSDREVVEDGFSVGATTLFTSSAAEVAWQSDPIHEALRQRFLPAVERVQVFDVLVAPPR